MEGVFVIVMAIESGHLVLEVRPVLLPPQFRQGTRPHFLGDYQTITVVAIWKGQNLSAGERREALLKVAEMSGAARPDHHSFRINRAIWLAGTGDGVKSVSGEEPHL
jgi:hypothetical protein